MVKSTIDQKMEIAFFSFIAALFVSWIPMLMTMVISGTFGFPGMSWDTATLVTWIAFTFYWWND